MKQLVIDPSHSDLGFKIRHLMVSNVKGTLTNYSGGLSYTMEDMSDAQIRFEAEVNSISTGNSDRDAHLNGEDFFNTERFPKMYFESALRDPEILWLIPIPILSAKVLALCCLPPLSCTIVFDISSPAYLPPYVVILPTTEVLFIVPLPL